MLLTDDIFLLYAAKYYENPMCHDILEFEEDVKRFLQLRKMFTKYRSLGVLKERIVLNNVLIIYNCFGQNATEMLFLRLEGFHPCLKPFVSYLNRLPVSITYNNKKIFTDSIVPDPIIEQRLKDI